MAALVGVVAPRAGIITTAAQAHRGKVLRGVQDSLSAVFIKAVAVVALAQ
jgi:hypothetical protein